MKKLLATLLLTFGFATAQAQSSVTLYGVLDMGYIGGNQILNSGSAVTKTTTSQFSQNAESTSRLGFRGSEDLGGGTSAVFTVEMQLNPQDTALTGTSATAPVVNRLSFVGLKQNGIGQVAFGRQYTPIFLLAWKTDPNQINNIAGNVIYLGSGSGAAGTSIATTYTGQENGIGYTNRASNAVTFQSDDFKGFRFQALAQLRNTNTTQTSATAGGENNNYGYGLGAEYTYKKLYVNTAFQQFTQETTGAATAWTDMNQSTLTQAKDSQYFAGGVYDFGSFKAYAQYVNRKIVSLADSSQFLQRSAQQIGVRWRTKNIEPWLSVGNGRLDQYGSTTPTVNFTGYQVGSNYWMSKRTNLYAIYGSTQTSSSSANAPGAGSSRNQYAVGMRHTF